MTDQKRKPKFRKAPTGQIKITDRDIEILLSLFQYRLLRTNQLLLLHNTFSSLRALQVRLQKLFHHGYIDRILEQAVFEPGNKPIIYAISTKGFKYLNKIGLVPNKRTDFTKLNKAMTTEPKKHKLLVPEVSIGFKASCKKHDDVRFIDSDEILKESPPPNPERKQAF